MATTQPKSSAQIVVATLIWIAFLVVTFFIMMTEPVWIFFWLWLPFSVGLGRPVRYGLTLGFVSALILIPHGFGFKIFGSAQIVNNQLFIPEIYIAVLGPGTAVTLSDGRTFHLAGVEEAKKEDGTGALRPQWKMARLDHDARKNAGYVLEYMQEKQPVPWSNIEQRIKFWEVEAGVPVLVKDEGNGRSKITFGRRCNYFCGNSFFPMPFPGRLPRYVTDDLALILLYQEKVVPDNTAKDGEYKKKLEKNYSYSLERRAEKKTSKLKNQ